MATVTVVGGSTIQQINYPAGDSLALANSLAAAIQRRSWYRLCNIVERGARATVGSGYVVDYATGPTTVTGTGSVSVLAGAGGVTFMNVAVGTSNVVATAGGNNALTFGAGTNDTVVAGTGNDSVNIQGGGTVDVGSGTNTVNTGAGSALVFSSGTSDLLALGSGSATVGESGTGRSDIRQYHFRRFGRHRRQRNQRHHDRRRGGRKRFLAGSAASTISPRTRRCSSPARPPTVPTRWSAIPAGPRPCSAVRRTPSSRARAASNSLPRAAIPPSTATPARPRSSAAPTAP